MKAFFSSLFLIVLVSFHLCAQPALTNQRVYDTIPYIPEHGVERIAKFEKEPVVIGRIMFLGNSITEGGDWKKLLNDSTVVNRGIGGDITYGMLKRMEDVVIRKPSKLFILIGVNDIGKDIPVAVIADNYKKIIRIVQAKSPETKIYVQSVLPLNPEYPGFPQHYDKQPNVIQLNQLLEKVAASSNCTFVNMYPVFLDQKKMLNSRFTGDGLHLNQDGYERWVKYLKANGYL